jgi:para-aminobenzoate synthetase component 1
MLQLIFTYSEVSFSPEEIRKKALGWAQQYAFVALYESAPVHYPFGGFRNLLAVSNSNLIPSQNQQAFEFLDELLQTQQSTDKRPLFGHLTYELKDELEALESNQAIRFGWPRMQFFRPDVYLEWKETELVIYSQENNPAAILQEILSKGISSEDSDFGITLQPRISREKYLKTVDQLRQHIEEGDVYEINFCQEFYAEPVNPDPVELYQKLQRLSPVPFGTFYKSGTTYLLGASPERFFKLQGHNLICQPIKGTAPRGHTPESDAAAQTALFNSEKERAENMMIVDLVRNDLARACEPGSISVRELFGIYPFRQVHQMISTVEGKLKTDNSLAEAFRALFPMGSMSGAPKMSALQLIEKYESSRRELFSGSIGYIFPDGTADWNVVIRSLQYHAETGYLNAQVGSAITWDSDAIAEYEECLLKASAMNQALH